jgi:hypothetical protein
MAMNLPARPWIARLLLALIASGWLVSVAGAVSRTGHHCVPGSTHAPNETHAHGLPSGSHVAAWMSALGSHECSHCPAADCSTSSHCAASASAALASAAIYLTLGAVSARPPLWVSERPLSANPTPPIPPPQLVL